VTWASTNCAKWWRQGRGNSVFLGQYTDQSGGHIGPLHCDVLFWYSGDKLNGPIHTNDQLVICGDPTFGRDPNDMIENSDTRSAKYEVLSAVDRAVSVTQMLRAGFWTGSPVVGSGAARFP